MSLPILKVTSPPTNETLVRYYHQTESNWISTIGESEVLDVGTAWCNPRLSRVWGANRMLDVALPEGMSPQEAFALVEQYFAGRGSICRQWVMNPSAAASATGPMSEFLLSRNHERMTHDIMYLDRLPSSPIAGSGETLTIIPARASFKHAQSLHEEFARECNEPQVAEAEMLHLDDPHYDALLALKDGQAAAHVGVLAMGETGRIDQVFVAEVFRKRRIGTTMMSRALEICARSLFKHVLLGVRSENVNAIRLYAKFGFRKIGEFVRYQRG